MVGYKQFEPTNKDNIQTVGITDTMMKIRLD